MLSKILGTAAALAVAVGLASSAHATFLSFSVTGFGTFSVDTGDITAATNLKTLPPIEMVNSIATPATAALAGISLGSSVLFSTLTLNTTNGPFAFTMDVGFLQIGFTSISQVHITPTGATTAGSISEQFNGTIIGDTSAGQVFLGQTASLSETCTQTSLMAAISCSESFSTPGLPVETPEPATLGLLGLGLTGIFVRARRRKV